MNQPDNKHGNWSDTELVIATSIAPVGIEKQQAAIQTWLDLGFSVVSLNIQKEIDKLKPIFKDVHFFTVNRDGSEKYGKPFVYVNDVLNYLREYGSRVGGIVNSDIHIRAEQNLVPYLLEQTKDSVVVASRVDIDTVESETGELYFYGFDSFFFERRLIQHYPNCDSFCLGIPWWDYWIPLIALNKSLNLKCLKNTFAYHVKHKINYSIENWREVGVTFSQYYAHELYVKLQHLYETNQLDELDNELGPNITYNLVQKVYREATLIEYDPSYLPNLASESHTIATEVKKDLTQFSNDLLGTKLSNNIDRELHYESLVWSAWRYYKNQLFQKMSQCLYQSLQYTSVYPSQCICNWIEAFDNFSTESDNQFDAYALTNTSEWKQLMGLIFELTPASS